MVAAASQPSSSASHSNESGAPAAGAKGELHEAMLRMEAMQDSVLNNTADEFTEISVFRNGYANWRKGR